eukprot:1402722-Amphidinium_carterae.1
MPPLSLLSGPVSLRLGEQRACPTVDWCYCSTFSATKVFASVVPVPLATAGKEDAMERRCGRRRLGRWQFFRMKIFDLAEDGHQ